MLFAACSTAFNELLKQLQPVIYLVLEEKPTMALYDNLVLTSSQCPAHTDTGSDVERKWSVLLDNQCKCNNHFWFMSTTALLSPDDQLVDFLIFFFKSPWTYQSHKSPLDDDQTLSVVCTTSQSCCQLQKRVVQHEQPQRQPDGPSSEIIHICVHVLRIVAAATIRGQCLFCSVTEPFSQGKSLAHELVLQALVAITDHNVAICLRV